MDSGQWTEDSEQWTVDSGQWTVDSGQWTVDSGHWTLDSGQWTLDSGQWTVNSGQLIVDRGQGTVDTGVLDSRKCSLGTDHRTVDSKLRKVCCRHQTGQLTLDAGYIRHSEPSSGHLTVEKIKLVTGQ